MHFLGITQFFVKGLNQEKVLNALSKQTPIFQIKKYAKNEMSFCCHFLQTKKVEKFLTERNMQIQKTEARGFLPKLVGLVKSYGLLAAILCASGLYPIQNQFVWQYQIDGTSVLAKSDVYNFVATNFSKNKKKINTKDVEIALLDNFEEISFASCIIKGQTLVISIKEKLLPKEIYEQFRPIISQKNGKITEIELISGTAIVKVGDYVKKGDVLVEPYTIDTDGKRIEVEADANITAEVYNTAQITHFEKRLETYKTGRQVEQTVVKLFGLTIYSFKPEMPFAMFEKVEEKASLSKNNILPLEKVTTTYFELAQREVESKFEDVKEEYLAKSREKALENCLQHDKIKEEYYTLKQASGATIINYCVVSVEQIGEKDEG